MGLLLTGALSGLGKGMSEIGAFGMKQDAETKRDQVKFEQGLEAARRSVEIQHELTQKYGAQASSEAQAAMKQAGGDTQKAIQLAVNPDAQKLLLDWSRAANDTTKLADQLATSKASRESSMASTEKSRMEIDSTKEIVDARRSLAEAEAKNINLNGAMQNIVDAKKAKLNTLSGAKNTTDPLSSGVSAAKTVLADIDARDEEKATAREFLANALKSKNQVQKNTVSGVVDYTTFFKK